MLISVRDYRGIERADVKVSPLALVVGLNGAGKTSILQAAAAAFANRPLPLPIHKKDAGLLVRNGSSAGAVTIAGAEGKARVAWPAAEPTSEGTPPRASVYAVGLASVLEMADAERARVLAEYLKADPSREDLAMALADADVPEAQVSKAWDLVERHGWDGAAEAAKAEGAAAKREWERLTGEKYGSAKAAAWMPIGATVNVAGLSETAMAETLADLGRQVEEARAAQEKAVRAEAAGTGKLAALKEQADRIPSLKKQLGTAKTAAEKLEAEADEVRGRLAELPAVEDHQTAPCPCCNANLAVKVIGAGKYRLDAVEVVSDEAKAERQAAIHQVQAELADAQSKANRAVNDVRALEAAIKVAEKAKADHEALSKEAATIGAAGSVDEAKAAVFRAEGNLKAAQVKARADALHAEILVQTVVVKALAPEGVRKRRLGRAVEAFNTSLLGNLCEAADWKPVTVNEDLETFYAGRPFALLSASEQFRVRIALQVAMARIDGSEVVIIDGAEILDPPGRNGLFGMLQDTELPAVVGMTVSAAGKAPDLARHGMGETYWVEQGQCFSLSDVLQPKAA